ncbi:MAG: dihydropteroate synthase [Thermoanaerobaculia bacterium]
MGILNVTPDSFSDGGVHYDAAVAVDAALRMERDGAAIVDVGGESTRPGADPVTAATELERVIPVIEGIRKRSSIPISIDTSKAEVADAALAAGADVVNDVRALRGDRAIADVVRERAAGVILMHMRGEPRSMQEGIHFENLMGEIAAELREFRDAAIARGIGPDKILIDPGIGFGKTFDQNLEILARGGELRSIAPLVIAASRKGFIGDLTGRPAGAARMAGSLAAVAAAVDCGAAMVRVHDVAESVDFLKVYVAVRDLAP